MNRNSVLVSAGLQYVFCVVGLSANILVTVTIVRYRKTTFSNAFYALAVAVCIPDSLHLCSELFCSLPAVFYGLEATPKWFLYSCGFAANVAFWGCAPLMLVIAVNRYMGVCYFDAYRRCFTREKILIMVIVCAVLAVLVPALMYGCSCYYDFRHAWGYSCGDGCVSFALMFNSVLANGICIAVVLIYVVIAFQYRRIRQRVANIGGDESRRRSKEQRLMFQFGLISTVLVGYQIFFWVFLYVVNTDGGEIVLNMFGNVNSCASSLLYLSFGSEIRSRLPFRNRNDTVGFTTKTGSIAVVSRRDVIVKSVNS